MEQHPLIHSLSPCLPFHLPSAFPRSLPPSDSFPSSHFSLCSHAIGIVMGVGNVGNQLADRVDEVTNQKAETVNP